MKNNKGITLIALVVTIIVLLILAGVSIAMLSGQNGILNRASEASWESKLRSASETISYNITEEITEYYNKTYNGGSTGESSMEAAIYKGLTTSYNDPDVTNDISTQVTAATDITSTAKTITLTCKTHTLKGSLTTGGIVWGTSFDV